MRENTPSQDMAEPGNIKKTSARPAKKPPKKITEKYLYNSGLAYLQRFPASTSHFRRVMDRKIKRSCTYHKEQNPEECSALLDKTVETFVRMGLLNDDAYLQGMINSLRRRGLSKQAILFKLQQKGMSQSAIAFALSVYDEERGGPHNPDLIAALMLAKRKKIGPFRRVEAAGDKEMAALARAGFGFDIAQKILRLDLEDAEAMLAEIRG